MGPEWRVEGPGWTAVAWAAGLQGTVAGPAARLGGEAGIQSQPAEEAPGWTAVGPAPRAGLGLTEAGRGQAVAVAGRHRHQAWSRRAGVLAAVLTAVP